MDIKEILESKNIEFDVYKNEILTYCPFCDHHKKKLSINPDKEVFQCWVCSKHGHINQLLTELKAPSMSYESNLNTKKPLILYNQAHEDALSYLFSRGIKEFTEIGYDIYNNAVLFPFYNPTTFELNGIKYKYINPDSKIPYKLDGQHPGIYYPNIKNLDTPKTSIILTEGEIDAISAQQYIDKLNLSSDFIAAATTGINNRGCVPYLSEYSTIYISFDNETDPKLKSAVDKALKALIAEIRVKWPEKGIKTISLPDSCKDMNDFLKYGYLEKDFKELLDSAIEYDEDKTYITMADCFLSMEEYLYDKNKSKGVPTFIEGIDEILGGGKRLGEITVLHAEAKTGKNCLWHKMMHNWLEAGIPIGYASRELSPEFEVLPNILSIHFKKNWWKEYHKGGISDDLRKEAQTKIAEWGLYFAKGYGIFDFEALLKWVKDLKAKKKVNHFFIDHLHYLLYNSEDVKEISVFCRNLKQLAKEENIHIDLIIQPRKLMDNQKLNLNSLRGGAAIGQAIDSLFILERQANTENISKLTLEVARHKLAKAGKSVFLKYDPITTDMWEVEEIIQEEEKEESKPKYDRPQYLKDKTLVF